VVDLSAQSLVLFAHVVSAIVLMAGSLTAPLTRRFMCEARSVEGVSAWLAFAQQESRWHPLAALVLLASGVYLGSLGWWTMPWFYVALAAFLVNAVLAARVINGTAARLGALLGRAGDGPVPEAVDLLRRSRAWTLATGALLANDLAILYVMYTKPSLAGCLLLLAGANLAAVAMGSGLGSTHVKRGLTPVPVKNSRSRGVRPQCT
jgi:hypothetical protein